ncbi:MAG: 23S rRNA (uracil(1939)-C(5))-methyltransferase RlmD [Clostridiales bacterium]|nr:23S rRNA (uracil(1939)-C(5))-methyltransferase RlmD [Clostridiales bacterium]
MNDNIEIRKVCPHDELCGGCTYQGVEYTKQLSEKESTARRYFVEKNAEEPPWDVTEAASAGMYEYRNKMEFTFGDLIKGGELTLGMHKKGNFMSIVTVDECQLVTEDFRKILKFTLEHAREKGYGKYNKKSHCGLLRNLIIRNGVRTDELLVNIVTSSEPGFKEEEFVSGLLSLELDDKIVGILRTVNDNIGDAVNPESVKILWGRDYYMEVVAGLKFKVSAFSFFQTNVAAAEKLYEDAVSLIDDLEGKTVFDLYCGTGTISQIIARRAKNVVGVELVEEAVEAARENAEINGITNCEFIAGDVYKVLADYDGVPDVIVVDPPRMGMSEKAVAKIMSYGVREILYVSCNPKTLAMNVRQFSLGGYKPVYGKLYDNFPMTRHVETVVLLCRKDIDSHIEVKLELDEDDVTKAESKGTYENIKEYVLDNYGFKVSTLYIAQIKRKCGLELGENYNKSKKENSKVPECPKEKEDAIMDALRYFGMIVQEG